MNTRQAKLLMTATATIVILSLIPLSAHSAEPEKKYSPSSLVQVIIGAAMTVVGSSIILAGDALAGGTSSWITDRIGSKIVTAGLDVLASQSQSAKQLVFSPIENWDQANSLGLSDSEARAYNSELKTIRWLQSKIAEALRSGSSSAWDERVAVDTARQHWLHAVDEHMISADAFSAVQKISYSLYLKSRPAA